MKYKYKHQHGDTMAQMFPPPVAAFAVLLRCPSLLVLFEQGFLLLLLMASWIGQISTRNFCLKQQCGNEKYD
jgi:hypothetical protein